MATLVELKQGTYSLISEAVGAEVAPLQATDNGANVKSTDTLLGEWINEGGRILARRCVALRGRRAAELSAREIVATADLALIQSPPGKTGTDHCGTPWGVYRVGSAPEGSLTPGTLTGSGIVSFAVQGGSYGGTLGYSSPSPVSVWSSTATTPISFAVTSGAGSIYFNGNLSQDLTYLYNFTPRSITSASITVKFAVPGTFIYPWDVTISFFARDANGLLVASGSTTTSALEGVSVSGSLAIGAVIAQLEISVSAVAPWGVIYYDTPIGLGISVLQVFAVEAGGSSGAAPAPASWLTFCRPEVLDRWAGVVSVGAELLYYSVLNEKEFELSPAMPEDAVIYADCLHLPLTLITGSPASGETASWAWLPDTGDRAVMLWAAAHVCEARRDDPRLGPLAEVFRAEFGAWVMRQLAEVPRDVRGLLASITGVDPVSVGKK